MTFYVDTHLEGVHYLLPDQNGGADRALTDKIKERYPEHELVALRTLDEYMLIEHSSNGIRNLARAWMKNIELIDVSKTVFVYINSDEAFSEGFIELSEQLSEHLGNSESKHLLVTGAVHTPYSRQCYARIQTKALPVLYVNSWEATCSEWMHESMIIDKKAPKTKDFICFNRHPRIPRMLFLGLLKYHALISRGHITFNADGNADGGSDFADAPHNDLKDLLAEGTYITQVVPDIAKKAIAGWDKFPTPRMRIHHHDDEEFWEQSVGQDLSHTRNLGEWELEAYNDSHYAVIPETAYFQDWGQHGRILDGVSMPSHFLTEKTWRHIGLKMPVIIIGRPGLLGAMRDLGYKTYHPYINEEYDDIPDDQDRMEAIVQEIKRMSTFTEEQWAEWHDNVDEITEHNYNTLKERGRQYIWSEDS